MVSISLVTRQQQTILFIGGGAVAERRLRPFLDGPCQILVISPIVTNAIREWAEQGKLEWRDVAFTSEVGRDIINFHESCQLVFACTDSSEVNEEVAGWARKHHFLVNRSDRMDDCDFTVPSTLTIGDIHLAISANSVGPRINKLLRMDMTNRYSELQIALPSLKIMREDVKLLIPDIEERQMFWRTHLTEHTLAAILKGEWPMIEEKLHHAISGLRIKP